MMVMTEIRLATSMFSLLGFVISLNSVQAFPKFSAPSRFLNHQMKRLHPVKMASLDDDLVQWAKDAGYGEIVSSKSSGSSGWASFRRVTCSKGPCEFFVKTSSRSVKEMFEGEAMGLDAMYECSNTNDDGLRIPKVFHYGDASGRGSFLVMEYLTLSGRGDDYALGRAVARMHLAEPTAANGNPDSKFGFGSDNTIGGTPQPNEWSSGGSTQDWIEFYRDKRIGHQLKLAGDSYCSKLWDNDIAPNLHLLFQDIDGDKLRPSLLHGDLWSGNIASVEGKPSIYDPATYWGHHEAEWGMDWCASFGRDFWKGYRSLIPKADGFDDRKPLYDAYHQLNHYNLFGGGYLGSARMCLEQVKSCLNSM